MTSFLLSSLARKFRGATLESFAAVHDHCWLVWEPGTWRPPGASSETVQAMRLHTPPPSAGEALALALVPRRAGAGQITVGRAPTNDIEINDATLSQVHLLLMESAKNSWNVRDAGSRNGTWLDGVALPPGTPKALADSVRIQAAQVCLTYYEPKGLLQRLASWTAAFTPVPMLIQTRH